MKSTKFLLIFTLGLITVLALVLRIYHLDRNVPPLYADEAGHYYYLQWLTINYPFNLVNIWKAIVWAAFTFTWFLGLTPLGVRLPAAIYGSLIPMAVYFLASGCHVSLVSRNLKVPVVAALLAAVLPWSFMISRIGHSHIPLVVIFVCLHVGLYLRGKIWWSFLSLIIAAYYYPSVIVILPFIFGMVVYQQAQGVSHRQLWRLVAGLGGVGVVGLTLLVARYQGFSTQERGLDLAIWRDVNVTADSNLYRGLARLSEPTIFSFYRSPEELANKLVYNYPLAIVQVFIRNYLSFFSPDWLFLKGDPVLRHSTGQVGAFYPFLLPFLVYGGFIFLKQFNSKTKQFFLVWILVSPIPAAITNDGAGYLLRVVTMLPFLTYLSALGIVEIFKLLGNYSFRLSSPRRRGSTLGIVNPTWFSNLKANRKNRPWIPAFAGMTLMVGYSIGVMAITLYSTYYFFYGYFHVYPVLAAKSFEYGFKEVAEFQMQHDQQSMLVIWPGYYPDHYFRFWQRTQLDQYRFLPWQQYGIGESVFYQTYTNLYFGWPKTVQDLDKFLIQKHFKFLVFPDNYLVDNPQFQSLVKETVKTINYPNETPAFIIYDREN